MIIFVVLQGLKRALKKMLEKIREIIAETKNQLQPLGAKDTYPPSTVEYFKYYGLDLANDKTKHLFGTFQSNSFTLAGHIFIPLETGRHWRPSGVNDALSLTGFRPKEYKATVVVLHSYLNHCGLLSKLIRYLLDAGFAVAVYDLPGHGLSSGQPTAIDDFSQYSDSLSDFMNTVRPILDGPYHLIGQSTGAAVIMDYLFSERGDYFDKVVLIAPLVCCVWWFEAKIAFRIYRHFAKNIFRLFRKNSSDKDFLRFVRYSDPLQAKKVSLNWICAFFEWNDKIANAESVARPIMVIQGANDAAVAWRYNLKFIQSKFSKAQIKLVEEGRHELFNESADICKEVFSQVGSCLEN